MMKKFLIIQTASIGDVILSTSVAEKLHKFYPDARIDYLVRKGCESLFKNHPFIGKVFIFNKKHKKLYGLFSIVKQVRKENYSDVINIHRFFSSGLISVFSGAKQTIGFDKNPFSFLFTKTVKHSWNENNKIIHEVERNLKLIEHLTDSTFTKPVLYPSIEDIAVNSQKEEYFTISPASLWQTKQFPEYKWVELINKLDNHTEIFLLGSVHDKLVCERIKTELPERKITIKAGELSLLSSAALIKNAKMNFVNDSANMHLASATNASVTVIYCSTTPEFGFYPLSDKSYIIEINEKLYCRPCGIHGHNSCPEKHFKCSNISAAEILEVSGLN